MSKVLTPNGWAPESVRSNVTWYQDHFLYNGQTHLLGQQTPPQTIQGSPAEIAGNSLEQRVALIHERSGPVAAAVTARALVLSDIHFAWRPSFGPLRYFGSPELEILEEPNASTTRSSFLHRAELDVSYAGNHYTLRRSSGLFRLRPDWVAIILGSDFSAEDVQRGAPAVPIGYAFYPGGDRDKPPVFYSPAEVAHWAPEPLPDREYLGGSWVSSVIREVATDGQATDHISKFFENAATANMVVTAAEGTTKEQFEAWVKAFDEKHAGAANSWRNIYLSPGTDVKVVGASPADLDLKGVVGGFENRVSARSRVPATVLGIREGMAGSALNAGNFAATRRLWVDTWFAPYATGFCETHQRLLERPPGAELTYNPRRTLLLQEDVKDSADIRVQDSTALDALFRAGFDMEAAVDAVVQDDFSLLRGNHSGVSSVQAQEGEATPSDE